MSDKLVVKIQLENMKHQMEFSCNIFKETIKFGDYSSIFFSKCILIY